MEYEELNKICLAYCKKNRKTLEFGYPLLVPTGRQMWLPEGEDELWQIVIGDDHTQEWAEGMRKDYYFNAEWTTDNYMATIQLMRKPRIDLIQNLREIFETYNVTTEEMQKATEGLNCQWLHDIESGAFNQGCKQGSRMAHDALREAFSQK